MITEQDKTGSGGSPPSGSPARAEGSATRSTALAAQRALEGKLHGWRAVLPFLGPAFVACVAYIDPGNFATNISSGAEFGYTLLWVVVYANIIAMLIQTLSAKLGIATARNLPELIREHFPPWVVYPLWVVAEIMAMATDLAEFVGAALGFNLLFHIPLLIAAGLTGVCTFAMLYLETRGFRPLEALITVLVLVVAACYVGELALAHPSAGLIVRNGIVPTLPPNSILLATGILGATVMPHVVFLHSALTQHRVRPKNERQARRLFGFTLMDVLIAMPLAGLVNGGMLVMAAVVFHDHGITQLTDLTEAYRTLAPLLGQAAALIFGLSLLASGISSSVVGTMAGQIIMQGFVGFRIPLWLRRTITMLPSFVVIALALPTATTLVISQVVLSLVLPFAIVPLVIFTSRRQLMGTLVNKPVTQVVAWTVAGLIVVLNLVLIYSTLGGTLPGGI